MAAEVKVDFTQSLEKLPPNQFARLAKIIKDERQRRKVEKTDAAYMTDAEFSRWAAEQISKGDRAKRQKEEQK